MNWPDERYVRVYTRDTTDWLALSFDAQALWLMLLRKFDRAGIVDLGRHGKRGIFIAVGHGHLHERLGPALDELLADGCVIIKGSKAVAPNFIPAQETPASDAQRKRFQRERARDLALAGKVLSRENLEDDVTKRDQVSRNGTKSPQSVTPSPQSVTPNRAVPCLTDLKTPPLTPPTSSVGTSEVVSFPVDPQAALRLALERWRQTCPVEPKLGTRERKVTALISEGGFSADDMVANVDGYFLRLRWRQEDAKRQGSLSPPMPDLRACFRSVTEIAKHIAIAKENAGEKARM